MKHVQSCTGDQNGWMQGLSESDIAMALTPTTGPVGRDAILSKIRTNHPSLFDSRTGAPQTPVSAAPGEPAPQLPQDEPQEQRGVAAAALKKAEDDLAQQNSSTSKLDLLVISAVLTAHAKTTEGAEALGKLQREINDAVRNRTDLDTPAGARDFQLYLIGKLRQIGAVVDSAGLEDTSKAALARAWSALYEASTSAEKPAASAAPPDPATPAPAPAPVPPPRQSAPAAPEPPPPLPPYGVDTAAPMPESWLPMDEGLPSEPVPAAVQPSSAQPAQPAAPMMPTMPTMPTMPMMSALPSGPGLGGGPPAMSPALSSLSDEPGFRSSALPIEDDPILDELSTEERRADERGPDDQEKSVEDQEDEKTAPTDRASAEATVSSTMVRLPDGDTITAPTPQIADAIRASLVGAPIGAAFAQQGITVPPAGTAVAHPIDPSKLVAGDIGMFTDRQALALDRNRAWFNGQLEPVTGVSGPSFLGWLHPSDQGTAGSSATTPNGAAAPPPTRPATTAGHLS
jgi:hypothetical protein